MDLTETVARLEKMAPLSLADSWDNVGLLIEPSAPHKVARCLLTNDLTEPVMQEALASKVNMIVSYHPPVFAKLKRITQKDWKQRLVAISLENRIAVFSPHTCYDAMVGGVNDWLCSAFVSGDEHKTCVQPIAKLPSHAAEGEGMGRVIKLPAPVSLSSAVQNIKKLLQLPHVRLAVGEGCDLETKLKTVAVCAGSGGGVFKGMKGPSPSLLWTGEMSHHEVLAATASGISVVLCEHSNTERGYLSAVLQERLTKLWDNKVEVMVAKSDADPLVVV